MEFVGFKAPRRPSAEERQCRRAPFRAGECDSRKLSARRSLRPFGVLGLVPAFPCGEAALFPSLTSPTEVPPLGLAPVVPALLRYESSVNFESCKSARTTGTSPSGVLSETTSFVFSLALVVVPHCPGRSKQSGSAVDRLTATLWGALFERAIEPQLKSAPQRVAVKQPLQNSSESRAPSLPGCRLSECWE